MKAEDDMKAVYNIKIDEPFSATILKLWIPVAESFNGNINGRMDALVEEVETDPDTVRAISTLNATTT